MQKVFFITYTVPHNSFIRTADVIYLDQAVSIIIIIIVIIIMIIIIVNKYIYRITVKFDILVACHNI